MNNLESIFYKLRNKKYEGSDTYHLFSQFYKDDSKTIKNWISKLFEQEYCTKCNNESDNIRKEGNKFYVNKYWYKSLQFYTKALTKAICDSESYALALANRSATLYSLKEYQCSLIDINRCLMCSYPDELKYKIYIRKIQCYKGIGAVKEADDTLIEGVKFITDNTVFTENERETYLNKLLIVRKVEATKTIIPKNYKCEIPSIIKNDKLLGASCLIGLRYNPEKGRHTVAEDDINEGDILFIEKAFAFAPIFDENSELSINKCYYCLSDSKTLIPCLYCSLCLFCNENCRTTSWNESHKWECKGMSVNLWSIVGIGFPALRVLLKGIPSIVTAMKADNTLNILNSENDYKFIFQLVTNIPGNEHTTQFLILAAAIIYYFETQTLFFKWLKDEITMKNDKDLITFFGGLVLKHIAQVACNASVIQHWKHDNWKYIPLEKEAVATGLYSAVSMMNHSCKSNISLYYINDIIIVKAADTIKKNSEIFNCYGIDYRYTTKKERLSTLKFQYQFQCSCEICENPHFEIEYLDTFHCSQCSSMIDIEFQKCQECGKSIDTYKILSLETEARQYLDKKHLCLEDIDKCYSIMKKIYNINHINLMECYELYKTYYLTAGRFEKAIEYFNKFLEIKKIRYGKYSWKIADEIISFLDHLRLSRKEYKKEVLVQDIKNLYLYAEKILPLNYPENYIDYGVLKTLLH